MACELGQGEDGNISITILHSCRDGREVRPVVGMVIDAKSTCITPSTVQLLGPGMTAVRRDAPLQLRNLETAW